MSNRATQGIYNIDWMSIGIYLVLVFIGWFSIYAAGYNELAPSMFDSSQVYGAQAQWMGICFVLAFVIMLIDQKFYPTFAYIIYGVMLLLLVLVLLFGKEVNGAKSWIHIGGLTLQPAELAKVGTCLALSKFLIGLQRNMTNWRDLALACAFWAVPAVLIVLQGDLGSAIVFASLTIMLYREGMDGILLVIVGVFGVISILALVLAKLWLILIMVAAAAAVIYFIRKDKLVIKLVLGLLVVLCGYVFTVDYVFNEVLQPHQQDRINVVLGKSGDDWNVRQSMIAIGSGGVTGKGFLEGTQTKFNFVPEQTTDFIFCTIGEEWGFMGSFVIVALFSALLYRITVMADRQPSKFTRVYAYGVACIFFAHFFVNLAMTIGLAPVIGIPLPFISKGGSSLMAFTILLFVLIKLDSQRLMVLR